jgi:D-apionolactonase
MNMNLEPVAITLGPVEAMIEPQSGQLRYVRVGKYEIMRGIYAAVRRSDWGTVVPQISDFLVRESAGNFVCTFVAKHEDVDLDFHWQGRIEGKQINNEQFMLEYEFSGVAGRAFSTCRTGVCVLHPRSQRGHKVEVEHHSGPCESGIFPLLIQPDQPFKDVKAVSLELAPGIGVRTEFYGEVFEMEDQRNWSDASYKTYCRPQEWGSPYNIAEGQRIEHRIKILIDVKAAVPSLTPEVQDGTIPNLGTVIDRGLSDAEVRKVQEFRFGHLQTNQGGLKSASHVGVPLFMQTQVASLPVELSPSDALVLYPPQNWEKLNHFRGARAFAASMGNFVDLNRCRPSFDEIEGVVFSMNPQVHAFDSQTIMECTWTFADSVATAKSFGAKTVVAGPLLLKQGGNDPRIHGIEAALYTIGAIANLSKAKADYATFFDSSVLESSPAALPLYLLKDIVGRDVQIWDVEPFFVMIQGERTILANLSWLPSEYFKQTPLDTPENIKVGIKGSYRLFTEDNIGQWKDVLLSAPSHNILETLPPRSIVVIGS